MDNSHDQPGLMFVPTVSADPPILEIGCDAELLGPITVRGSDGRIVFRLERGDKYVGRPCAGEGDK